MWASAPTGCTEVAGGHIGPPLLDGEREPAMRAPAGRMEIGSMQKRPERVTNRSGLLPGNISGCKSVQTAQIRRKAASAAAAACRLPRRCGRKKNCSCAAARQSAARPRLRTLQQKGLGVRTVPAWASCSDRDLQSGSVCRSEPESLSED